jgi:hypothetical protein
VILRFGGRDECLPSVVNLTLATVMMLPTRGVPWTAALATDTNLRLPHRALARAFEARQPASGSRCDGVNDRAVSWSGDVPRPGRRIPGPARSRRGSSTRCCVSCAAPGAARVGELLPPTGSDTAAGASRRRSCKCRLRRVEACGIPRGYRRTSDEPPPRASQPTRGPAHRRRETRSARPGSRRGQVGDVVKGAKRG